MMQFVSDKIGDDYKEWEAGDEILIDAQTGSGKTYFVLHVLLKYAQEQNRGILYLVNRIILKRQLEQEIMKLPFTQQNFIKVETYQNIETGIKNTSKRPCDLDNDLGFGNYYYAVCDEAHYFSTDANFNTNTIMSYRWIQCHFGGKIRIYISATMELLEKHLDEDWDKSKKIYTKIYGFASKKKFHAVNGFEKKPKKYRCDKCYDYIQSHILESSQDVAKIISKSSEKWLIFVDSIGNGKNLCTELKNTLYSNDIQKDEKVIFLSADYRKNPQNAGEVSEITRYQKQKAIVLIATAVLDNGISLKDLELRNIILMVDVEDEFLQMLGRKREDGKPLNLYLFKQNKQHFQQRLYQIDNIYEKIISFYKKFGALQRAVFEISQEIDSNYYCNWEYGLILEQHIEILNDMIGNKELYESVSRVYYSWHGILLINQFALERLEYLKLFYENMLEKYDDEGEYAFVKVQLGWIGKNGDEIESIIKSEIKDKLEEAKKIVVSKFEEFLGKEMDAGENKEFVKSVKNELLYLIKAAREREGGGELKTVYDIVYKGTTLTEKGMDQLRQCCNLGYKMEKPTGRTYRLIRVEQ